MKIITNPKLIARNAKIGLWGQIIGLLLLLSATVLSFQSITLLGLSLILFAFGLIISQTGIYFGNRWSRRPRPDEYLDKSLKGLDRNYTLYHYRSPIAHLLIGPAGIWALLPRNVRGKVTYLQARGRWKHKGGAAFLKFFGQEGLGRPELDLDNEISRIETLLANIQNSPPPVHAALVFTHEEIHIEANNSPVPAIPAKKLKSFVRKQAKQKRLSDEKINEITALLSKD
jgi:hypothetical protein